MIIGTNSSIGFPQRKGRAKDEVINNREKCRDSQQQSSSQSWKEQLGSVKVDNVWFQPPQMSDTVDHAQDIEGENMA
jgi:hypothetical protein